MFRRLILAGFLALWPLAGHAQSPGRMAWMQSWAASPAPPMPAADTIDPRRLTPSFQDQTIVQVVRLSTGGARLRVRFSNEYGLKPLVVGAARVSLVDAAGAPLAATNHALTFGGRPTAKIPAGAPLLSDPVDLPSRPLAMLRIALYLPETVPLCTCHVTGGQHVMLAANHGDHTQDAVEARPTTGPTYRAFVTGVDVLSPRPGPVIVAFGDSITDGYRSTDDANHRWPDRLAERLIDHAHGRPVAVLNAGIGGNRILSDGMVVFMGQSALTRFDRDVLATPGATHLIVLEGVNDIGAGGVNPPSAADLIAGYRQLIERAHVHGLKVIGATILPYEGAAYFHPEGEEVRQALNRWIRTSGGFDQVIDFDAAIRDPARPSKMRADLQSGDWLHPNDAGYRVMGDAVDLSLFGERP